MHRIGIISDTHGLLRPEVLAALKGCEMILHGGDINKQEILDRLSEIAPIVVVRGNNDKEWAEHLPITVTGELCGIKYFMVHNKKQIPKDLAGNSLVVYGHSHKYDFKEENGVTYFNPGSCGPRRFNQEITLGIMKVEDNQEFHIEKILIPHKDKNSNTSSKDMVPADLAYMLPVIMKEISSGKTVKQIAKKHHISEELSEQINRMYLTHPGIDVDGILRRLGI